MSQDQQRADVVKGSNLGFIIGILVVVAVTMLVLNTSFIQEKLGKKSKDIVSNESEVGGFEIIEEPEITLLDENEIEELEDVFVDKVVDTHEPVDTALGDVNTVLLSSVLFSGAGALFLASKRLVK